MAGRLHVPGFGLPYEYSLHSHERFSHGVSDGSYDRMTVRELAMLGLMDTITDKPEWRRKIVDEKIVAKWREEALKMQFMSEKAFEWCIRELQEAAAGDGKLIATLNTASRCIKSDDLISEKLQSQLKEQIQPLLQGTKDWHPESGEKVLDLVHPSLYPAVYGRTRVLPNTMVQLDDFLATHDSTSVLPAIQPENRFGVSQRFQWLPCDIAFQGDTGTEVKIVSYINNLRPDVFHDLYRTIEGVIEHSIPAWNAVLVRDNKARTPLRIVANGPDGFDPPDPPEWTSDLCVDEDGENFQRDLERVRKYVEIPEPILEPPIDWQDFQEIWEHHYPDLNYIAGLKFERLRRPIHPEPDLEKFEEWTSNLPNDRIRPNHSDIDDFEIVSGDGFQESAELIAGSGGSERVSSVETSTPNTELPTRSVNDANHFNPEDPEGNQQESARDKTLPPYPIRIENDFREQGLQVIVKLASIELSPDKPQYDGGNWHLEGTMNEHIVATTIYYFDSENVSESRIRFRHEAYLDDLDLAYEQDKHEPLCEIFGTTSMRDELPIQEIGSIATPGGRLLAFPNTLQHKVEPFRLLDPTKNGHRRILVLWLVDPHYRILSTRHVPPQQYDWWVTKAKEVAKLEEKVPKEVQEIIFDFMKEGTMTLEEAKQYRLELMQERVGIISEIESQMEQYNLCEH